MSRKSLEREMIHIIEELRNIIVRLIPPEIYREVQFFIRCSCEQKCESNGIHMIRRMRMKYLFGVDAEPRQRICSCIHY